MMYLQDLIFRGANKFCGILLDDNGPFGKCKQSHDLNTLHNNCLYDMCLTNGDINRFSEVSVLPNLFIYGGYKLISYLF